MNVVRPPDLARLRIERSAPRRHWWPWALLLVLAAGAASVYPTVRAYLIERRAPEVEVSRAVQLVAAGGSAQLPVLVASGYVVARRSSDVGVKAGGRLATLRFEEGTRVRRGEIIATIEHADLDAQLAAARLAVAEAETALAQMTAARDEDDRNVERQRALAKDGITTDQALTAAESAAKVSNARVRSAEAAIASARARVTVIGEALENTNVRAPFDGVVIRKRAEVGETVSPYGVQGQATREGGAIATIADLRELEVQTEVSETSVAKLRGGMPAEVRVQAYQTDPFNGRVRDIFPSADRAKSIVEVRVTILNADARVKPEMTASVTFQEPRSESAVRGETPASGPPLVLVPKRAVTDERGQPVVWVVADGAASRRLVTLGPERIDQVEIRKGLAPGEVVILNPSMALKDGGRVRIR
jgi:HlyD family secretion protein